MSDPISRHVATVVERYVEDELSDTKKLESRTPLDEPGIDSLYRMAGTLFLMGYQQGEEVAEVRGRAAMRRLGVKAKAPTGDLPPTLFKDRREEAAFRLYLFETSDTDNPFTRAEWTERKAEEVERYLTQADLVIQLFTPALTPKA